MVSLLFYKGCNQKSDKENRRCDEKDRPKACKGIGMRQKKTESQKQQGNQICPDHLPYILKAYYASHGKPLFARFGHMHGNRLSYGHHHMLSGTVENDHRDSKPSHVPGAPEP